MLQICVTISAFLRKYKWVDMKIGGPMGVSYRSISRANARKRSTLVRTSLRLKINRLRTEINELTTEQLALRESFSLMRESADRLRKERENLVAELACISRQSDDITLRITLMRDIMVARSRGDVNLGEELALRLRSLISGRIKIE